MALSAGRIQLHTKQMELDSTRNAVFSLKYHLIVVVKYRRQACLRLATLERLHEIATAVGEPQGLRIDEMNGEADHVHFLLSAKPRSELSKFVNAFKSASSRVLKREFPEVAKAVFLREALWSPSYFICSVRRAPIEVLKRYIEQQKAREAH